MGTNGKPLYLARKGKAHRVTKTGYQISEQKAEKNGGEKRGKPKHRIIKSIRLIGENPNTSKMQIGI